MNDSIWDSIWKLIEATPPINYNEEFLKDIDKKFNPKKYNKQKIKDFLNAEEKEEV